MTIEKDRPLRQIIQQTGLRVTEARLATLEFLQKATSPVTHADVATHLGKIGVDQATAFRNLTDFVNAGIVHRTGIGDRVWRFEIVRGDRQESTFHSRFLCLKCGKMSQLKNYELNRATLETIKRVGEATELLLRGYCRECGNSVADANDELSAQASAGAD